DPGLLERALLSMTVPEVDEIIIDAREEHEFLLKLARRIRPDLVQRIKLHDASIPLFHAYGVEEQLATALSPVVELPSGGYIVIETTEALTSIDVNSGRVLSGDSAEVLLRINLEAADEIARQLRLRDIGGLIVIDFLDMMRSRDWIKLMDHLERALSRDYARTKIVTVSPIGVVELTRQRHGYSLAQTMLMQCPCCSGTGRVKSPITVALEIRRCLFTESELHPSNIEAVICAHPEALAYFASVGEDELQRLEMRLGRQIWLFTNNSHHVEEFSIAFGAKALSEQLEAQPQEGTQVAIQVPKDVHPSDEPLFAVVKNRLVRLPPMQSPLPPQLSLRIMRIHRWYTEATWMPSIDEEVSEQLRKPAQAVEPDS
ncbi:MAG TPA: hypothetical protein EYP10_03285, partial [Armatimonadetes bacterium]|nr:hypothetical protein [Armatimonadota bacterium]